MYWLPQAQENGNKDRLGKMDSRLLYSDMPSWQQGFKQALHGTEIHIIKPYSKSTSVYEFQLPRHQVLLFGSISGFMIKGCFESKANSNANDSTFSKLDINSGNEVILQPNWFEHLIHDIQLFCNNQIISVHDVPRNVDPFLNTYLFAHMHNVTRDCLFPEVYNPGRCVGLTEEDWSMTDEKSKWRKYSKELFGKESVTFRYLPFFVFPFYQQANLCIDGRAPAALPMSLLGNSTIILHFNEKWNDIFMKSENNEKVYRFRLESIELVLEEARLNPIFEKKFLSQKSNLVYQGVSKVAIYENINTGALNHRCRFQNVLMPEGIFIFAIPNNVINGLYKCTALNSKVFSNHNIKSIDVKFENKPLAIRSPKLGDVQNHLMEIKQLLDNLENPPFGVLQNSESNSFNTIGGGGAATPYPHIYINLTPSGKKTRIIPVGDDGHIIAKKGDLDLDITFADGGATEGVTYMLYIFYTDVNVLLDTKKNQLVVIYKHSRNDS